MMESQDQASLSVAEYVQWNKQKKPFNLLDVRGPGERLGGHLGGHAIPMEKLAQAWNSLPQDLPLVVYCRSGCRSANAIEQLRAFGYQGELYNLEKGILGVLKEAPTAIQSPSKEG